MGLSLLQPATVEVDIPMLFKSERFQSHQELHCVCVGPSGKSPKFLDLKFCFISANTVQLLCMVVANKYCRIFAHYTIYCSVYMQFLAYMDYTAVGWNIDFLHQGLQVLTILQVSSRERYGNYSTIG